MTITTPRQIERALAFSLAQEGKPYLNDAHRFGPDHFDCSGLVVASWHAAGIAAPLWAITAASILRWGQESGREVPISTATRTRGALLVRIGPDGPAVNNHIAWSLGDGRTIEARGRAWGVVIGSVHGRGFDHAMQVPNVTTGTVPPAPNPAGAALAALALALSASRGQVLRLGSVGLPVRFVQARLGELGFRPGPIDGIYGRQTIAAVRSFQHAHHIAADGVVGPVTWRHLYP